MSENKIIVFIENFKSIYSKQNFEISIDKVNTIIGPNGIGKTNLIEAIDWLINNKDYGKITSIINKNVNLLPSENRAEEKGETFCGIAIKIEENEVKKILNKLEIEEDEIKFDDLYKINIRKSLMTGMFLLNSIIWENKEFKNFYQEVLHVYLNKIKLSESIFDKTFIKENDNKLSIDSTILENLIINLTHRKDPNLNDTTLLENYQKILKNYKFIKESAKIKVETRYIENASYENETSYSYTIDKFEDSEFINGNDLLNLLSANVDLSSEFMKLKNILIDNNSDDDDEYITKLQTDIYNNLNNICNKYIDELFSKFDIYAKPKVIFNNNKIVIEVVPKNEYQINAYKTANNSSGYKAFFELILKIESLKLESKTYSSYYHIIFADEPDKNLHPFLQRQLCNYFNNQINDIPNLLIILTTHSPFFMNVNKDNFIIIDRIDESNYKTNPNFISGSTVIKKYKNKLNEHKLQNIYSLLFASKLMLAEDDIMKLAHKNKIFISDIENIFNIDDEKYKNVKIFCEKTGCEIVNLYSIIKETENFKPEDSLANLLYYQVSDFDNSHSLNKIEKDIYNGKNVFLKLNTLENE